MNTRKSHTSEFKYFSIESESREQYFKRAVAMLSGLALTLSSVSGCASTNNELKPISTPSSILSPESTPATDPSRVVDQGELPTADQIVDIINTPGECVMMAVASVPVNYRTSSGNMNSGEAIRPLVSIDGRLSASGGICEGVNIASDQELDKENYYRYFTYDRMDGKFVEVFPVDGLQTEVYTRLNGGSSTKLSSAIQGVAYESKYDSKDKRGVITGVFSHTDNTIRAVACLNKEDENLPGCNL